MNILRPLTACAGVIVLSLASLSYAQGSKPDMTTGKEDRQFWIGSLTRIADPVLNNLSKGTLAENMPHSKPKTEKSVMYLEAVGRLVCGIAPWLELGPDNTPEGKLRDKYIKLTVKGLKNAVDPSSPDRLNFSKGSQPLVDAAFLAQGLLRAPKQLWGNLDEQTKSRMIEALKSSRVIRPGESNWLLFATMVEAALLEFTGECDDARLMKGINSFKDKWYKGDGHYGDGAPFHMDYYNSFVIHPMLQDSLKIMEKHNYQGADFLPVQTKRFTRYAEQQERFISPEGTFPAVGRSLTYRFGALQVLAQAALLDLLPKGVTPQQVRSALTAVMKRQLASPANFDDKGWLEIGFAGKQPRTGEYYISRGSPYLCSVVFLPLGLPETHPFWAAPYAKWTSKKAWEGDQIKADHSIKN